MYLVYRVWHDGKSLDCQAFESLIDAKDYCALNYGFRIQTVRVQPISGHAILTETPSGKVGVY